MGSWESSFYVGRYYAGGQHFNGVMDELVFYNRALSAEEIANLAST